MHRELNNMDLNSTEIETWVNANGFEELDYWSLYTVGIYYTITTVSTVGYGDISPVNNLERWLGLLVMFFGILAFSYVSGTLTSFITSSDAQTAMFKEQAQVLEQISAKYQFSEPLKKDIEDHIKWTVHSQSASHSQFFEKLPDKYRLKASIYIYDSYR